MTLTPLIPAKAGIQVGCSAAQTDLRRLQEIPRHGPLSNWIPAFAGMGGIRGYFFSRFALATAARRTGSSAAA